MTPGAVDPHVTLADICTGHTKERRHLSPAIRAKVLQDYNVSDAASVGMEMDHLIPLALGGANTAANLWPQPVPDYETKDRLEIELQRRVCSAYRTLVPAEAEAVLAQERREIAEDWSRGRPAVFRRQRGSQGSRMKRVREAEADVRETGEAAKTKPKVSVVPDIPCATTTRGRSAATRSGSYQPRISPARRERRRSDARAKARRSSQAHWRPPRSRAAPAPGDETVE